ncbi:Ger(x)C family spore germination protein [Clostridium algidicarnis]|uniref:Ger(x)C family spore germination protein n=1 Tax=Clostridium algidicarnis TaxID=37659 RepID=UPI001C0B87B8|nr:Ger(x)C family spore germination protein [Clostridium algidicarnis]MBU3206769.1 Ger(x)C family spore germination protein [Clostridium algidicarnis]
MKKYLNVSVVLLFMVAFTTVFCGCWDYTEMTDLKYLAGMAIDRDKGTGDYIVTFEILEASTSSKVIKSDIIEGKGKTIHESLRDAIKKSGKMLQVSHAKMVIVSKDIANEGIIPVIDLINRDVEVRNDMWILISDMDTASEILSKEKKGDEIISYDIASSISNSNKIGSYLKTEIFKVIADISNKGLSATIPMIKIDKDNKNLDFDVFGTAIFKGDKMVGKLNEHQTITLSLLKEDELKFVFPMELGKNNTVTLEIMDVNRKIIPKVKEGKIVVDVNIDIDTSLSELASTGINYISKDEREKLKKQAEKYVENSCKELIEDLQKDYKSDIIGFGDILKKKKPNEWRKVQDNWQEAFQNIDTNFRVNINIKYSGITNKNIEVGD